MCKFAMQNLALENEKWQKKVAEAEKKLADGLREIELTTNDYLKLKVLSIICFYNKW